MVSYSLPLVNRRAETLDAVIRRLEGSTESPHSLGPSDSAPVGGPPAGATSCQKCEGGTKLLHDDGCPNTPAPWEFDRKVEPEVCGEVYSVSCRDADDFPVGGTVMSIDVRPNEDGEPVRSFLTCSWGGTGLRWHRLDESDVDVEAVKRPNTNTRWTLLRQVAGLLAKGRGIRTGRKFEEDRELVEVMARLAGVIR